MPKMHEMNNEYERLMEENKRLQDVKPKQNQGGILNESQLKEQLGDRFDELGDLVNKAKEDLLRVAQMAKQAIPMQIKIQHSYQYSKWDSIHEPFNVVENILKDDESIYKALTPDLDLTVAAGAMAYISEVVIYPGDCGPSTVELYWSNTADKWTLIKTYQCSKSGAQKMTVPGEHIMKYLRIRCVNNIRGGNLVNVRYVQVRGLTKFNSSSE
jgi:hypothetical protein